MILQLSVSILGSLSFLMKGVYSLINSYEDKLLRCPNLPHREFKHIFATCRNPPLVLQFSVVFYKFEALIVIFADGITFFLSELFFVFDFHLDEVADVVFHETIFV